MSPERPGEQLPWQRRGVRLRHVIVDLYQDTQWLALKAKLRRMRGKDDARLVVYPAVVVRLDKGRERVSIVAADGVILPDSSYDYELLPEVGAGHSSICRIVASVP